MSGSMKTAVISGGAGGLGRALTARLLTAGWRVVVLDLDVTGLERHARQWPIACDLTDAGQLARAMDRLLAEIPAIDLAIYNAGLTWIGPFDRLTDTAHRRLFEVNYFAATAMAQALLNPVRAARGTHLAISSVAGFSPLYHRTAYAASKHALEGAFSSLRSEERRHGVRVLIAAPSFVATNPGAPQTRPDGTARPGSAADGVDYMTPDTAARIILRGVERGRARILVGRVARLAHGLHRLSPALLQRLMERRIAGR